MRGAARHAARAADEEVRVAATEAEGGSTGASLPASLPASPIARHPYPPSTIQPRTTTPTPHRIAFTVNQPTSSGNPSHRILTF